jgi:hypothetical protein
VHGEEHNDLSRSLLIAGEVTMWDGSETHEMHVSYDIC